MSKSIFLIPLLVLSSAVLAKDPVPDDSHTLDAPVGYDQAVEFTTPGIAAPASQATQPLGTGPVLLWVTGTGTLGQRHCVVATVPKGVHEEGHAGAGV